MGGFDEKPTSTEALICGQHSVVAYFMTVQS